jgi:hypothetical protein
VRQAEGLEAVPWGNAPWLPRLWAATDDPARDGAPRRDAAPDGGSAG